MITHSQFQMHNLYPNSKTKQSNFGHRAMQATTKLTVSIEIIDEVRLDNR